MPASPVRPYGGCVPRGAVVGWGHPRVRIARTTGRAPSRAGGGATTTGADGGAVSHGRARHADRGHPGPSTGTAEPADGRTDPYPLYRTLRTHHPLVYDEPFGAWLVSRYDDVRAALADPRLVALPGDGPAEAGRLLDRVLHGPALAALTAAVERGAHVLARRLAAREEADLVAEFCDWLPTATVVAALGLPYEETARVHCWCRTGLGPSGGGRSELGVFLRPLTARRRAHPGGDLLSVLCAARTDESVTGLVGALLGAAGETSARALASFLRSEERRVGKECW